MIRLRRRPTFVLAAVVAVLAVFAIVHRNRTQGARSEAWTARFPDYASLGTLYVRDWGTGGPWTKLGEAEGEVDVPAGKELILDTTSASTRDKPPSAWQQRLAQFGIGRWILARFNRQPQRPELSELPRNALSVLLVDTRRTTGPTFAFLARQRGLRELYLAHSRVRDDDLRHLKGLRSLEVLFLSSTAIGDAGLAHLERLSSLRELMLSKTRVTDSGLGHLEAMKGLELLDLRETSVTDAGLSHLRGLDSLQWLDLAGAPVSDTGLAHIEGLPALLTLHLEGTQISDASMARLARFPALKYLYLTGTRIGDAGLEHFQTHRTLAAIHLRGTRVTAAGIDGLKEAIPRCQAAW